MLNLGKVRPGRTIYIPFDTFAGSTGASITLTGLAVGDILVYKDGGTTQRASTSGFTLLDTDGIDFDAVTGVHGFSIDLSDNTTADFWAAGSRYVVVISSVTVDAQTVNFVAAIFEIGQTAAIFDTTIATLASQTSFTLTAGPADDDAFNGCEVVIHDAASAVQMCVGYVLDYTGSTKTVTLANSPAVFTIAAKDNISFFASRAVKPTVDNRTLDISTGGEAGIDWANVGSPTTTLGLTNTTVGIVTLVTTATTLTNLPAITANWLTAAGIAADAITEIQSGLATAAALTIVDDFIDTEVAAIKAKTDLIPASPAAVGDAMTLTSAYDFSKGTVAMTESYAADGATMTAAQALYMILCCVSEFAISGTTLTGKKLDGTTTAMTWTLDSSTAPTSRTRAS